MPLKERTGRATAARSIHTKMTMATKKGKDKLEGKSNFVWLKNSTGQCPDRKKKWKGHSALPRVCSDGSSRSMKPKTHLFGQLHGLAPGHKRVAAGWRSFQIPNCVAIKAVLDADRALLHEEWHLTGVVCRWRRRREKEGTRGKDGSRG